MRTVTKGGAKGPRAPSRKAKGPLIHLHFLFNICFLRFGIKSTLLQISGIITLNHEPETNRLMQYFGIKYKIAILLLFFFNKMCYHMMQMVKMNHSDILIIVTDLLLDMSLFALTCINIITVNAIPTVKVMKINRSQQSTPQ